MAKQNLAKEFYFWFGAQVCTRWNPSTLWPHKRPTIAAEPHYATVLSSTMHCSSVHYGPLEYRSVPLKCSSNALLRATAARAAHRVPRWTLHIITIVARGALWSARTTTGRDDPTGPRASSSRARVSRNAHAARRQCAQHAHTAAAVLCCVGMPAGGGTVGTRGTSRLVAAPGRQLMQKWRAAATTAC
jgi:hypothetical protein